MNKDIFDEYISIIKTVDYYLRSIDPNNIGYYQNFYPFIDDQDISLYNDTDKTMVLNFTVGIILKSKMDISNRTTSILIFIVSYILTLKYLTDCTLYKPYSFFRDFILEISDIKYKIIHNKKEYLKKMIKIERRILNNINYFVKQNA
jgi:hypothetical protein